MKRPVAKKKKAAKPTKVAPIALGATGIRQPSTISALAVSPDGTRLATGDEKGRVRVFAAATGACTFETTWQSSDRRRAYGIQRLAFSPDGSAIAATTGGFGDGHLCVGHLASGATWFESRVDYTSFAWAPDGRCLATIQHDTVALIDARDGTARHARKMPESDYPRALAWTSDGAAIVVLTTEGDEHKTTTFAVLAPETLESRARHDLGVELYGAELVAASDGTIATIKDHSVLRFHPKTGRHEVTKIRGKIEKKTYLARLVGPRVALFQGRDAAFLVDLARAKVARTLPPDAKLVAASADGAVIATAHGVAVQLWTAAFEPRASDPGLTTKLGAIAFSADGETVVTADESGVRTWSATGAPLATLAIGEGVDLTLDGSLALVVRDDKTSVVEVPSGKVRASVDHAYRWGKVSCDGKTILTRHRDNAPGCVLVTSMKTGKIVHTLKAHNSLYGSAYSRDGTQVASGSFQGAIAVHDAKSGRETTRTPGDGGYGQMRFAFHPNGKLLASGDHRRTVRLWSLPSGKVAKRLRGHRRSVIEALVFSPDGELLASADEADVRVWNVRTGKAIGVARIGTSCVAFSPDGKRLAVGGNGEAWILDIASMDVPKK